MESHRFVTVVGMDPGALLAFRNAVIDACTSRLRAPISFSIAACACAVTAAEEEEPVVVFAPTGLVINTLSEAAAMLCTNTRIFCSIMI